MRKKQLKVDLDADKVGFIFEVKLKIVLLLFGKESINYNERAYFFHMSDEGKTIFPHIYGNCRPFSLCILICTCVLMDRRHQLQPKYCLNSAFSFGPNDRK